MANHSKYDNKFEVKHWQQLQNIGNNFDWEPAMILEPVIVEYKRYKWVSIIFNVCDFLV